MASVKQSIEGPIPARAGEPDSRIQGCRQTGAYPRSRGGTARGYELKAEFGGLSPLARGNLLGALAGVDVFGPIPARAGEPR